MRNLTLMVRIAYEKVADALDLNIIKVDDAGDVIEHSLTGDKVDLALFAIGQLRTMIESLDQKYQDQFCGGKPH
ncbi:MAG TPA: hypothetical protein VFX37_10450 [Pseudolabrys sp.]|nr:hypothetical protein [Pseudolabrys sp.]